MTMKRCIIPSILLMLALEVAGRPSAVAVTSDEGTILLPSEGKAVSSLRAYRASRNGGGFQAMGLLRQHHMHQVDECASTCMDCVPSVSNPFRRVCGDQYFGDPGPKCTNTVAGDHNEDALKAKGDHQDSVAAAAEEEKPWECCDQVEQCATTCKSCGVSILNPFRRVCNDWYNGFPGRRCTEAAGSGGNN
uniref:Bowman-Birk serine protease inhibitors family domain-containing protein n=1 Tax=Triticum aestivum TaxID=4565 RepID=A0A077RUK5_WHEAT|nr:unnamed protein product [Triticum aestivum]